LKICNKIDSAGRGQLIDYPTNRLQKGLLLLHDDHSLAEEAVGFGVPLLMRGHQTIFPGKLEIQQREANLTQEVEAIYSIDLLERLSNSKGKGEDHKILVELPHLYTLRNALSALMRRYAFMRSPLTTFSNILRQVSGWVTTFEPGDFCGSVKMKYTIPTLEVTQARSVFISVEVEPLDIKKTDVTQLIVMNEQGGTHFDLYQDSSGNRLAGSEISCWDEVKAEEARFTSPKHGIAFSLRQMENARLYRGRELMGSRLAWCGFGYTISPRVERFGYNLKLEKST